LHPSSDATQPGAPRSARLPVGAWGAGLAGARRLAQTGLALAVISAALLASVGGGVMASPGTAAASVVAGTAAITEPGSLTNLNSGGSGTLYGVQLPAGASCPGDSAHQGYRVDSYLVPKGVSPASINFKRGRPNKGFGYIADGAYYGAINTAIGSGLIVGLPAEFTWGRLTPKDLFPQGHNSATWEGGIACATTDGVVTNYWNSQIVFTASTSDPGGFTWRVVAQPALAPSHKWLWVGIALIVLSILLAALAVFLSQRRDNAPDGSSPSPDAPSAPSDESGAVPGGSDGADQGASQPSVAGR
jgi:hypothetical protein